MKATLYTEKLIFGTIDLIEGDVSMGNWYGFIEPIDSYYSHMQKPIQDFWKQDTSDYSIWEQFRISILLENGLFLHFSGYTITDLVDFSDERPQLDLIGVNPSSFTLRSDYFKKPWHKIQISQKIHFENQLLRETRHHQVLIGVTYIAIAQNTMIGDTLFAITQHNEQTLHLGNYFVVHLTYTTNNIGGFPFLYFYESLEHFYNVRMVSDSIDFGEE